MKAIAVTLAALAAGASASLAQQTVLFDFGRHDGGTNGNVVAGTVSGGVATGSAIANGGSVARFWNSVGLAGQDQDATNPSFTGFVDTNNNPLTGWTIASLNGNVQGNGFLNGGLSLSPGTAVDPTFALLGDFAVDNATGDYWFVDNGNGTTSASFILSGLDNSKTYSFTLLAARVGTTARFTHYTLTGATSENLVLQSTGLDIGAALEDINNDQVVTSSYLSPNAGSITISWTAWGSATAGVGGGTFGYINDMSISVIPEPSYVAAFAGLGALAWVAVRRRRQ